MKPHFFKMIREVSLCLQLKKDVLGRGFISLECSTRGTAGPLGIRTRGWGKWARAAVCDPRKTSYQGPGLRAAAGLAWRPSLRICSTPGCVEAPVPPFPKGAVRQRESLELLRGRGRRSCLELCSGRGGEGGGLCCLDRWSGSQLGTLYLAEWRPESPQENPQVPTV